jgi:hypothetical protein
VDAAPSAFETRFREITEAAPVTWRELLKANIPSPGELELAAPPRPGSQHYVDAHEERRRWHGLLRRHSPALHEGPPEVRRMLELLAEMEANELELCARVAAENGGR